MTGLLLLIIAVSSDCGIHEDHAHRFSVTAQQAESCWRFAMAHCQWLVDHGYEGTVWELEARWCRDSWDQLDNIKRFYQGSPEGIRRSLLRLRELIGTENYETGWMPPPAPYWRFRD